MPESPTTVMLLPATLRHVHLVASRMRREDREEVLASGGYRPAAALRSCLSRSEIARTAFIGGEPLCMFGVLAGGELPTPWLLTTDLVDRYPLSFWRASKLVMTQLRNLYPVMAQAIDGRYTRALSWARRLGFAVGEPIPFGFAQRQFYPIAVGV